jgi:hypothetical protein
VLRVIFQEVVEGNVTVESLGQLKGKELKALAMILGVGPSGTKPKVTDRILDAWSVRLALAGFVKDDQVSIEPICAAYQKPDLKMFCKRSRSWRSGNKRQLAACLLMWRARCRRLGSEQRLGALVMAGWDPNERLLKI